MSLHFFEVSDLLTYLKLKQTDEYRFEGTTPPGGFPRIFGGQVMAQSLSAASQTVPGDRVVHSLHAYFLRPGNPSLPIQFEVDPIRDGKGFTTRRVVAKQNDKAIFNTSISFQVPESGLEHQFDMPDVPAPETLENDKDYWLRMHQLHPEATDGHAPHFAQAFDIRHCDRRDLLNPEAGEPCQNIWFKVDGELPDNPAVHRVLLSYICDMALMGTALRAHPASFTSHHLQGASLDHAMWFHDDFRADEWLLYHMDSPRSSQARGLNRGSIYTQDGRLVASTIQEGLMRVGDKKEF
ncbi:MAG: acyl-CoA thioesterase II [Pseudomonadota bacterium]|nr:acyl-CoA thioesterase II [Pseudomonadota bacterium]